MAAAVAIRNGGSGGGVMDKHMDGGKYVRYTAEQVEALERVYAECPKPSSMRRQQLIRECPILSNIEPKQIKVWFQNRRCREKQRKETSRLQTVNRKLTAMNKLLMEENDRLQKQVSRLVHENAYMRQQLQNMYAPTTIAPARDFWTLRYTTTLEDGSLVVCERSLSGSGGGPSASTAHQFVRAEMLPSGFLIRPCDGGGSIVHIVDHLDLEAWNVPEVLRPLYESSKVVAQKMTTAALHHIRQIAQETSGEVVYALGRQPAVLRTFSQRLSRGFNDAINGFIDDGWSLLAGDGAEDVVIATNSTKTTNGQVDSAGALAVSGGIMCAKASMLLQFLEVIRLEGQTLAADDGLLSRDVHLLQDALASTRTLDLASSLEVGSSTNRTAGDASTETSHRSILTIAFQFPYEVQLQESVTAMARQYIRSIVAAVQRVSVAISPSQLGLNAGQKLSPGSPEAVTLAHWICQSYRQMRSLHGYAMTNIDAMPVFTFANQAGLDMLETTLVALQDITLDKIFDESGRKALCSEFAKLMQQGYAYLPGPGVCLSGMGRHVSFEQAVAWKVLGEDNAEHCLAFSFINWSFV
ncbi:hypothetical protein Taro_049557 [Colocasia esculenta]|uniref:Class III HD-Zip protein n=1 Tax=Colocasia esculenta TaxID=4460 RepID=A0A843XBC8_COLES|nr:hypothetical protein [Colocasia esculenta]